MTWQSEAQGTASVHTRRTQASFYSAPAEKEETSLVFGGWSTQAKMASPPSILCLSNSSSSCSSAHRAITACRFLSQHQASIHELSLSHDQDAPTDGPVIDNGSTAGLSGCTPSPAVGLIARCIACFAARSAHVQATGEEAPPHCAETRENITRTYRHDNQCLNPDGIFNWKKDHRKLKLRTYDCPVTRFRESSETRSSRYENLPSTIHQAHNYPHRITR